MRSTVEIRHSQPVGSLGRGAFVRGTCEVGVGCWTVTCSGDLRWEGWFHLLLLCVFYADTVFLYQSDIAFVARNRTRRDEGCGLGEEQGWQEVAGYGGVGVGWQALVDPQPLGMSTQPCMC